MVSNKIVNPINYSLTLPSTVVVLALTELWRKSLLHDICLWKIKLWEFRGWRETLLNTKQNDPSFGGEFAVNFTFINYIGSRDFLSNFCRK